MQVQHNACGHVKKTLSNFDPLHILICIKFVQNIVILKRVSQELKERAKGIKRKLKQAGFFGLNIMCTVQVMVITDSLYRYRRINMKQSNYNTFMKLLILCFDKTGYSFLSKQALRISIGYIFCQLYHCILFFRSFAYGSVVFQLSVPRHHQPVPLWLMQAWCLALVPKQFTQLDAICAYSKQLIMG